MTTERTERTGKARVKRWVVLFASLGVLVLAIAVIALVQLRPLAVLETTERWKLRWAGLERQEVSGPRGSLVYWRGGTGTFVFFLHGANDQAGTWAAVVPTLLTSHQVVLADLAGHGDSAPADGPLSMKDLVDGVEALVAAEARDGRVTLVGNSLGGWLALTYADRHPDRVAHVILVNGAAIRGDGSEAKINLLPGTREEARQAFDAVMSPSSPRVPAFVLDDLIRRAPTSPLARLMATPVPDEYFIDARLAQLSTPVTLIWGEDDRVLPASYARKIATALPAARLELIERCGHVAQRECPDRLRPLLERALGELPEPR